MQFDSKQRGGGEIDVGEGLRSRRLVAVHDELEVLPYSAFFEDKIEIGPLGIRCDGFGRLWVCGEKLTDAGDQPLLQLWPHQLAIEPFFVRPMPMDGFVVEIVAEIVAYDIVIPEAVHAVLNLAGEDAMLREIDFPGAIV